MEGSPKPPASPTNLLEEKVNEDRGSPEANCAICLGKSENKSFTDGCLHRFCFSCLLEWSKVKAECPLCKMTFRSIIHNVRSNEHYDVYHLPIADAGSSHDVDSSHLRPYRPTRESIYEENLWVSPLPDIEGQYRECSPQFYRLNPAQVHSLVPWVSRELDALFPNNRDTRDEFLCLLLQLLPQISIRSEGFRTQVFPFLQGRTSHFLHELYEFARSPYDLDSFDQAAHYVHISNNPVEIAAPDSDVVVSPEQSHSQLNSVPSLLSPISRSLRGAPDHLTNSNGGLSCQPSTSRDGNTSQEFRNERYFSVINSVVDSSSSTATVDVTGEANQGETQVAASDPDVIIHSTYCDPEHKNNVRFIALSSRPTRRCIYEENLWVSPLADIRGRSWECSPEFYRLNPDQLHRLVPWVNRELAALLPNNPGHKDALFFLLLRLLEQYPIRSLGFRSQVSPYLGEHTSHFIHEFYEFARSAYNMHTFDQAAKYVRIFNHPVEITSSSDSDSDVVLMSPESSTSRRNSVPPHHEKTYEIITLDCDPQEVEKGEHSKKGKKPLKIKKQKRTLSSDSSSNDDEQSSAKRFKKS